MGNLCSGPKPLPTTPGQTLNFQRDDVTKITYMRLGEELTEKDAKPSAEYSILAENDKEESIKAILDELFNQDSWEYGDCTKEDFKGAYALTLDCKDGSSFTVFVGMEATSVLPEFDLHAETHKAFKSTLKKELGLRSSLYEHIEKLPRENNSEIEDASTSDVSEDALDEFDEPAQIDQTNPSSI
jgi:hypothetical protein